MSKAPHPATALILTGNSQDVTGKWMTRPTLALKAKVTHANGLLQMAYGDATSTSAAAAQPTNEAIPPK